MRKASDDSKPTPDPTIAPGGGVRLFIRVAAFALLVSCGDPGPVEITLVREISPENDFELPRIVESDLERFRYQTQSSEEQSRPAASVPRKMTWTVPDGWKEIPPSPIREINLRFGPSDEGECYVTRLSGGAGGLASNVNRWRGQMGAAPLSEEEVMALEKKPLFGQDAVLVTVDGTYQGMGKPAVEDARLVGLILTAEDAMVTVKMTGPRELVVENEAKFDAFCASLDLREGN